MSTTANARYESPAAHMPAILSAMGAHRAAARAYHAAWIAVWDMGQWADIPAAAIALEIAHNAHWYALCRIMDAQIAGYHCGAISRTRLPE